MDMTVVTSFQAATVAKASLTPGYALTFSYQRKLRGAAGGRGYLFMPLVVESLGDWHSAAWEQHLPDRMGKRKVPG